jgi:hypothetical protein
LDFTISSNIFCSDIQIFKFVIMILM